MDLDSLSRNNRLIFAYHGCDRELRDQVLRGEKALKESTNDYDWLGKGIYFWENGPTRAMEWAKNLHKRGKIRHPSVIGAIIDLGKCFDLLDVQYPLILSDYHSPLVTALEKRGIGYQRTLPLMSGDHDLLLRKLDCAVINFAISALGNEFDTVRGVFQEGGPAFENSRIYQKSHIQIAVRNPACIRCYFMPVRYEQYT
jgi:hypothetical protein